METELSAKKFTEKMLYDREYAFVSDGMEL